MTRTAIALAILLVIGTSGCVRIAPRAEPPATDQMADSPKVAPKLSGQSGPLAALAPDPLYRGKRPRPYAWAKNGVTVAHGLGGIQGKRVTNSLEAFQANYKRGYRVFEVDLVQTTDGTLAARHDWEAYMYDFLGQKVDNPYQQLDEAAFKALPIHDKYTPLTIDGIVTIMKAFPDTLFITDTKSQDPVAVRAAMSEIMRAIGPDTELADRFIVQIYDERMLSSVRDVNEFKSVIYTLYQLRGTKEEAVDFAQKNGIRVVAFPETMWTADFTKLIRSKGLRAAVYTVNDPVLAQRYRDSGVSILYSDFLKP